MKPFMLKKLAQETSRFVLQSLANRKFILIFVCVLAGLPAENQAVPSGPPASSPRPLTEEINGTKITDNYRWLENGNSPETQKWIAAQMAYTRSELDPLRHRDVIHKRLTELLAIGDIGVPRIAGKYYFYTRREGLQNQPVLYVREGINGKDRVLIDVNSLAPEGTLSLDYFWPSEHGKYVAYGVSSEASEMSTLHIIETRSGRILPDTIERTADASIAWMPDSSGFYYTRHPSKGDVPDGQERYNRHVFFHEIGADPAKDPLIFGEGRDPEDWPSVSLDNDGRMLLISVAQGWSKSELFLMDLKKGTPPTRITTGKNFLYSASVYNGRVYIVTDEDAPRYRMFVTEAGEYDRDDWKEIVPQTGGVLKRASVCGGKIFAEYEQNASSQLKVFDLQGNLNGNIELPSPGTVFDSSGKWDHDEIFYGFESFTVPASIYRYDLETRSVSLWAKVDAPAIDASLFEVEQEWFHSKDGTRVPMFLIHKKGLKKDGHNPTILTGDGGFGVSLTPKFDREEFLWLEHGGVFAVANLRGGSEFGEDWHRAGMLDKKQNVFDDMVAGAEYLISEKYTDKDHLAMEGGSNGGLLIGAMITQRPDLLRAAVCRTPVLDMLRYQNFLTARRWIPEYGSPEKPEEFKWLHAYSPYQHVKAGTEYPAVMFMTADSDFPVDPLHARKMTALMQNLAANGRSKARPILLREESKTTAGTGTPMDKQINEATDMFEFLFWQLGVK